MQICICTQTLLAAQIFVRMKLHYFHCPCTLQFSSDLKSIIFTCSRSARENFRSASILRQLIAIFFYFYLKGLMKSAAGFDVSNASALEKNIFIFLTINANLLLLITLSAYIFLLVSGQGSRPLPPIGLTKVSNSTVPCLIIDQSYANQSAFVIG